MTEERIGTDARTRIGVIGANTLLLTASFVGVLAFVSGAVTDLPARLPWYFVVGAVLFVGTIVVLEEQELPGRTVILTATVVAAVGFLAVVFAVEGVLFAVDRPEALVVSRLLLYFLAAGLVGTGVGYWGLNHWRELSTD